MVNKFSELLRKVRFSHSVSKSVRLVTVKFRFRYTVLQKCFQTDAIFFYQGTVSAIKFQKRLTKFKIMRAVQFGSKCSKGPSWFNYWCSFTLAYSRISHEYSSLFIIVINLLFMFSL